MITQIFLQNFKCFRTVSLRPKQITAFVGANGTGKSSVLQAFGLLKQTFESMHDSQARRAMVSGCDLNTQGPLVNISDPRTLSWHFDHSSPEIYFAGTRGIAGRGSLFSYRAQISLNKLEPLPGIHEDSVNPSHSMLTKLRIIPAVRGITRPAYRLRDEIAPDIAMEEEFAQQEAQTATNLAYSPSDIEKTSPLLKRITGVGLRADTVPPQSVEVKSITTLGTVNLVSEGFGTNSLIMLLLQLTTADRGATVMIEEPEIHLHPKAQAELASVLAEVALEEDKQVIMTTHSEHITGRLLTLVAEGTLSPDDVAIYAFEKDEEGGCTAKDLRITPDGTIEGGINDFFETNLEEMNRFVQAQFKRVQPAE